MADKIYATLLDKKLYQRLSEKGLEHSKKFTWDKCAKETIKVYERVVST